MINVTRKAVVGNQIVPPTWYPIKVTKLTTKPASTDQSTNYFFSLEFLHPDLADVRIKDFLINEKGIFGSGMSFLIAGGFPKDIAEKIKNREIEGAPVDPEALVGKEMMAAIKTTTWEGRQSNEAHDFLPAGATPPTIKK